MFYDEYRIPCTRSPIINYCKWKFTQKWKETIILEIHPFSTSMILLTSLGSPKPMGSEYVPGPVPGKKGRDNWGGPDSRKSRLEKNRRSLEKISFDLWKTDDGTVEIFKSIQICNVAKEKPKSCFFKTIAEAEVTRICCCMVVSKTWTLARQHKHVQCSVTMETRIWLW